MSMCINDLFEHDASMRKVVAESSLLNPTASSMSNTIYESAPEAPEQAPKEKAAKSEKGEKGRHRASIACAACRDRRIRCVVPPGEQDCTQCKRSKSECIIRNDDERRRPISKAYMSSLTDRVSLLETMLAENGKEVPPANYPPKTRTESSIPQPAIDVQNQNQAPSVGRQNTTPRSLPDESIDCDNIYQDNMLSNSMTEAHLPGISNQGFQENNFSNGLIETHPLARVQFSNKERLVHKLLSTRGHLSFDQLSGRLRFFGPTSNCHIYADQNQTPTLREMPEQARRTERIIRSLSIETHDYLMNLFWEYYNSVLHIVHKEAFNEDMQNGMGKYYSGFLHISILAMGYRYADVDRDDMKMITLGTRECTLHREAKYMLDMELERPGGIPSVQAFLLLGDLECGVGRDNTGWMYAGMANRLCFDIGLHLDCQNDGLPEEEVQIRHMTLFACVIYDKYWALFLGRPTGIKSSDLEMYRLSKQFACLSACKPAGVQKSLETQIYEELLNLMELAGKIAEIRDSGETSMTDVEKQNSAYLYVMNLDRQLQTWYRRLPENLMWKPANIQTAPYSFFLLHQQYHCSLILLHRPWAKYEDATPDNSDDGNSEEEAFLPVNDNHSFMSRSICTRQAIHVARIFWHHRQRFDTRKIFVTGIQHAGTAATALVAALAFIKNVNDRKNNMQYLECLAGALSDMADTFQPAAGMSGILEAVMCELSNAGKTPPPDFSGMNSSRYLPRDSVTIPARRDSNAMDDDWVRTFKKRQLSKSSTRPSTLSSDFAKTPASFATPSFQIAEGSKQDGYVMITPGSERATWPSLNSDLNALDFPMTFTGIQGGMWLDGTGQGGFSGVLADATLGDTGDGTTEGNQELDFLQF